VNHAPPNVTPYGAIAYRLDDIASRLSQFGDRFGAPPVTDLACELWGVMDDLVALNQAAKDSPA
jgi:hypothetical protein